MLQRRKNWCKNIKLTNFGKFNLNSPRTRTHKNKSSWLENEILQLWSSLKDHSNMHSCNLSICTRYFSLRLPVFVARNSKTLSFCESSRKPEKTSSSTLLHLFLLNARWFVTSMHSFAGRSDKKNSLLFFFSSSFSTRKSSWLKKCTCSTKIKKKTISA